jgi:hypothetical protein
MIGVMRTAARYRCGLLSDRGAWRCARRRCLGSRHLRRLWLWLRFPQSGRCPRRGDTEMHRQRLQGRRHHPARLRGHGGRRQAPVRLLRLGNRLPSWPGGEPVAAPLLRLRRQGLRGARLRLRREGLSERGRRGRKRLAPHRSHAASDRFARFFARCRKAPQRKHARRLRVCSLRPSGRHGDPLAISTSLQVENRHGGGNPEFIKASEEEEKRA